MVRFLIYALFMLCSTNANAAGVVFNATMLDNLARIEIRTSAVNDNIKISQDEKKITINFFQRIDGNPQELLQSIPGYIANASLSTDLSSIILETTKPFRVQSRMMEGVLFLDLIGMPSVDLSQFKPQEAERNIPLPSPLDFSRPEDNVPVIQRKPAVPLVPEHLTAGLNIDVSSSEDKTLFGFVWDRKVAYKVNKVPGGIEVDFRANVEIDDNEVRDIVVFGLKGFSSKNENGGLQVFVPVPPDHDHKVSRDRNTVIVSIHKKVAPQKPAVQKVSTKKTSVVPSPETVAAPLKKEEKVYKADPVKQEVLPKTMVIKAGDKPEISFIESENKGKEVPAAINATTEEQKPKAEEHVVSEEATMEVVKVSESKEIDTSSRTFSLSFPWNRDIAAALFQKQGYWWFVFDRKTEVDFSLLRRLGGDVVHEIVQIPSTTATVIRIVMDSLYFPSVRKEGMLWIMDITRNESAPKVGLEVEPQPRAASGSRLFIPTGGVGNILKISDPEIGDSFIVVPVYGLGWGIGNRYTYPDLVLPKTLQGIVIEPRSDGISVKATKSGVEITRPGYGIRLSSDISVAFEAKEDLSPEGIDSMFDLSAYEKRSYKEFQDFLPNFLARAALATQEQKNLHRLSLARLYLANGYVPEALSVLDTIAQSDFSMTEAPQFLAVRGMANLMFGREELTIDDLNREIFDDSRAAKLWLAAAFAKKGEFSPEQFKVFRQQVANVDRYPSFIRYKLSLLAVQTALDQENENAMSTYLEMMNREDNTPYQKAAYNYYKGLHYEFLSAYKDAIDYLEKAKNSTSQRYHALGARDAAKLYFKLDSISLDDLARRLERLRYAWRGDDFEYNLMRELADIYLTNERYPEALRKLREITVSFPDRKEVPEIKRQMESIFEELFLKDKAERMDPITSIALFNEFRNLVPKGSKGADMVKILADRLVSVDLLDSASSLLEEQLQDEKIQGHQRGVIGTRLALIRLLEKKPKEALQALDNSVFFPIGAELDSRRDLIRAKALADSGNLDAAIKLLNSMNSEEAKLLKVDLLWTNKKWDQAADAIQLLVKKPEISKPLPDNQARLVLYWATALKLAGGDREKSLVRLRENYITYMNQTSYKELFDIISSQSSDKIMEARRVADEVNKMRQFGDFLNSYVKNLKNNRLSDMVR